MINLFIRERLKLTLAQAGIATYVTYDLAKSPHSEGQDPNLDVNIILLYEDEWAQRFSI